MPALPTGRTGIPFYADASSKMLHQKLHPSCKGAHWLALNALSGVGWLCRAQVLLVVGMANDKRFVVLTRRNAYRTEGYFGHIHLMLVQTHRGLAHQTTVHTPARPWELTQFGNCGSPIETEAGWLVLTHGVGPMRTYSIGALLLDLEHPERVLASLPEPLITATAQERDGYVPNVVYSCGAMRHQDTLVIPYGTSDTAIAFATLPLTDLLARMRAPGTA